MLSSHRTLKSFSQTLPFPSAEETPCYRPSLLPFPPHFPKLTESPKKGFICLNPHLQLKWTFASLTCSGLQQLASILYLDPGLSAISVRHSHGLNWGEERKRSRDGTEGKRKENTQRRRKTTRKPAPVELLRCRGSLCFEQQTLLGGPPFRNRTSTQRHLQTGTR